MHSTNLPPGRTGIALVAREAGPSRGSIAIALPPGTFDPAGPQPVMVASLTTDILKAPFTGGGPEVTTQPVSPNEFVIWVDDTFADNAPWPIAVAWFAFVPDQRDGFGSSERVGT